MSKLEDVKNYCNAMQDYKPDIPFTDRKVTLICIQKDGSYLAAHSWQGKVALALNKENTDTFLLAWTGKYTTSIFPITHKELDRRLKAGE